MQPKIINLAKKKLVGINTSTSWANDKTTQLWSTFMPRRKEIKAKNTNYISLQIYGENFDFQPETQFEKWALAEVEDFSQIPDGMKTFTLQQGLYVVFHYKGLSSDTSIFQYIYGQWLPSSGYILDNRPHFEVLGEKYKNNDPESEEEIWIPVKKK